MKRLFGRVFALDIMRRDLEYMPVKAWIGAKTGELRRAVESECPTCASCGHLKITEKPDLLRDSIQLTVTCGHGSGGKRPGDSVVCPDGFAGVLRADMVLTPASDFYRLNVLGIGKSVLPSIPDPLNSHELLGFDPQWVATDDLERNTPPPRRVNRDVPATAAEVW